MRLLRYDSKRLLRYLFVPWTIFLVYALFSLFFGQNGLYVRRHLEAEYARLLDNRRALEDSNRDMLRVKNNLMYDTDSLAVYMRQLGYGKANEKFIRIIGMSPSLHITPPAGQVLYAATPDFVPDKTIKLISLFFGLVIMVYFLIGDFFWHKENSSYYDIFTT